MQPIWKDYTTQLAATPVAGFDYTIYYSSGPGSSPRGTIFAGRAFARPGATSLGVCINDIVATVLRRGFEPAGETDVPWVEVEVYDADDYILDTIEFNADWSYDPDFNPATDGMNHPILDTVMPGQLIPVTMPTAGTVRALISVATGVEDFNADFNRDFLIQGLDLADEDIVIASDFATGWFDLRDWPAATAVTINGKTYRVGGGCHQFVLYYVNAYGGWDTMVVTAKTDEQDAVTRYTMKTDYNNATAARGTHNYINELAHNYTFRTGCMDEAASLKMHHLLNSPHVWLHDVIANRFYPIVLTNSATEYKNGGRLYQYEFTAQLAQERIRR